jgi:hypothetical protein
MGSSFVEVNDRGFWMRDGMLELWLRFLALHIEEPTEADAEIRIIRDQWLLASRGFFSGCVPTGLDEQVSTPNGKKIVVDAINALLSDLRKAPDSLDKDVLKLLGMDGSFTHDVETWRLIEVGQAFLDLIDGKITSTAESTEFMPGCGESRTS